jgi:hypothetical protein
LFLGAGKRKTAGARRCGWAGGLETQLGYYIHHLMYIRPVNMKMRGAIRPRASFPCSVGNIRCSPRRIAS